jgi:hypothetical protein
MKRLPTVAAVLLAGGLSMAAALPARADGAAWAVDPVLPDPSLANGPVFKPSTATAGTAAVSALADGPLVDCSRRNPCAMPTPARDHVAVAPQDAAAFEAVHVPVRKPRHMLAGTPRFHS